MKSIFSALFFLSILAITSACATQQGKQSGQQVFSDDVLIECAVSMVHLCKQLACESVPVFFIPEDKYPLKINLKTQEVVSLYDTENVHRSLVMEARKKSNRLEIIGRSEKSTFNEQPIRWLMQIYYESGNMVMSGNGKKKGVVIFGSCQIGEAGHVTE